ncbi:unknown protein [Seminavis robusta]|uniref:Methyltransferase FkbM domain-containing protein n=1 Tax=Seminavis robusta TaxID=568900 RepID=A0A9N8H827_9STRA|nr:unknown protein [Seminavis robusta]|eukprot:Sro81_g043620.1 n/a (363) ;mRNA; f:123746-125076
MKLSADSVTSSTFTSTIRAKEGKLLCFLLVAWTASRSLFLPGAGSNEARSLLKSPSVSLSQSSASPQLPASQESLFKRLAPLHFPMDMKTGIIQFPPDVTSVIIDIGARQSDYLGTLEKSPEESYIALILIDPLPESITWGHWKRVPKNHPLSKHKAVSGQQAGTMTVMVFPLKDLLDHIPSNIKSIHLKVDAEGADLQVLKSAGDSLKKVSSVVIECQDLEPNDKHILRQGSCLLSQANEYMCQTQTFCNTKAEISGPKNCMRWSMPFLPNNRHHHQFMCHPICKNRGFNFPSGISPLHQELWSHDLILLSSSPNNIVLCGTSTCHSRFGWLNTWGNQTKQHCTWGSIQTKELEQSCMRRQ